MLSPRAGPDAFDDSDAQDIAWMERVKQGDLVAFEALIEAHQARVIGTVVKMLGDETDAEDIAQQAFIRVWNSASRYTPSAKFTTWLFTIVRNLVFNEMRRRKRHPVVPLERNADDRDERDDRGFQASDAQAKVPSAALIDAEMQHAIQEAIDALPEVQRTAVVLRRYQDVSYEEIAKILDLSVPAVKSVLFRARTELRARLKRYLEE